LLGQAMESKQPEALKASSSTALDQVSTLLQQANGGNKSIAAAPQQKALVKEPSSKTPYCCRCLTKGHRQEECFAELFCDICNTSAHNTDRCPQYWVQSNLWQLLVGMLLKA
jgi:hypothetical protein